MGLPKEEIENECENCGRIFKTWDAYRFPYGEIIEACEYNELVCYKCFKNNPGAFCDAARD